MNKVLVTGGEGLVGSAISSDYKISRKECDLRNFNDTYKNLKKIQPDGIIHCAAKVGGILSNINHQGEYFYDNVKINANVIEASRKIGVKNLVAFLSTCVFPDKIKFPLHVSKIFSGEPHSSNYGYSYAKRMAEIQIKAYNEQYGTNYKSIIPSNIYGPRDNFSLSDGHVIPMLIHKIFLAKKMNKELTVWGTGKPLREFIFSKDIAKLSEWVLFNYHENAPLIISGNEEISIKDLVGYLIDEFQFKGKVVYDFNKPDGQYRKPSDNRKIKELIPNFEYTPLEEGLRQTVNWFKLNYDKARK